MFTIKWLNFDWYIKILLKITNIQNYQMKPIIFWNVVNACDLKPTYLESQWAAVEAILATSRVPERKEFCSDAGHVGLESVI